MAYDYKTERGNLFTEDGLKHLLTVRDKAKALLSVAGAFRGDKLNAAGDSWLTLAALDYMIEQGELTLYQDKYAAQYQVYTAPLVGA